jgi:TM2 domain-containing membrane protein YozV
VENNMRKKSVKTAKKLCLYGGYFGLHRFYLGQTGLGLAMLFTFGMGGLWWLIDYFIIENDVHKYNRRFRRSNGNRNNNTTIVNVNNVIR